MRLQDKVALITGASSNIGRSQLYHRPASIGRRGSVAD